MVRKISLILGVCLYTSSAFAAWEVRQTTINHVQVGNGDIFYITINGGDVAGASGCSGMTGGKNWMSFEMSASDERKKAIMAFALAAQASKQLVDVGGDLSGCNAQGTAELQFIRVGDWMK